MVRILKLYSVIFLLFLSGCSPKFNGQEIEEDCFPAFTQEVSQFFDVLQNDQAYIWAVGGVNDDGADTPFLVKNNISGFLLPDEITRPMETISPSAKLNVTGRIFKKWPNWGESIIGGGEKNIKLEVVVEGKTYLVFDFYIPKNLKSKLQGRCTFE